MIAAKGWTRDGNAFRWFGGPDMSLLAVVVIGRNEGERLVRCLDSIGLAVPIVYVDSGSTDDSLASATAFGAHVVALDMTSAFTAARARNAGRAALDDEVTLIQFVDGDCVLQSGWLHAAQAALEMDEGLAAVFGRGREVAPRSSVYNWLCDLEWAIVPGPARYFGGVVMLRAAALDAAGGYPEGMIAGEEPDLALRLRAAGWRIEALPVEMMLHDAAMTRFSQWWRRSVRSGYAYAELAARHGGDYQRRLLGALFWGAAVPMGFLLCLALGQFGGALMVLALPLAQFARLVSRQRRPLREGVIVAAFLMFAKVAQTVGSARYWLGRWSRRRPGLIEYRARS